VDYSAKTASLKGTLLREGDWLSLNGSTGEVLKGKQPVKAPELSGKLAVFMEWVDSFRKIGVYTNADTPADAAIARKNGAQGIGLVRTEHMFFATAERIAAVRRMIAAEELMEEGTSAADALASLKEFQREDFEGIFTAMDGLPVTIRLLDPPLHEFLPHEGTAELDALCDTLAKEMSGRSGQHMNAVRILKNKIHGLQEANPMLGLRGCRLGIRHPDITEMQAKAILEAAVNVSKKVGAGAHLAAAVQSLLCSLQCASWVQTMCVTARLTTGCFAAVALLLCLQEPRCVLGEHAPAIPCCLPRRASSPPPTSWCRWWALRRSCRTRSR
jgi:pyruvate,orthophosphate dikinase